MILRIGIVQEQFSSLAEPLRGWTVVFEDRSCSTSPLVFSDDEGEFGGQFAGSDLAESATLQRHLYQLRHTGGESMRLRGRR